MKDCEIVDTFKDLLNYMRNVEHKTQTEIYTFELELRKLMTYLAHAYL